MKIENIKNIIENKINGSTRASTPTINKKIIGVGVDALIDPLKNRAITLIALIITIILMLILVGVTLSLTLGENGIFKTAKYAVVKTEEEKAREKLELALADLTSHKYTTTDYNENEYIDNYLTSDGMIVVEDIVIVDGWIFTIDRSVPKIGESLGKGEESKKIALVTTVENAPDYITAKIKIEINYEGTITQIKINGQEIEIPEKQDGKYILKKEVDKNGRYTIYARDENDEYKTTTVNVTEISEDMEIRTAEDLVWFRDRVNKGATYFGKTIKVVNHIDLSKVCYKVDGTLENDVSWKPIGDYGEDGTHIFKGTFKGNYKTISNLYINSIDDAYQGGLFGYLEIGKIEEIIIANSKINSNSAGFIANANDRGTIYRCKITDSCEINLTTDYGGAAGIVISNGGKIEECISSARINSNGGTIVYVGGITGVLSEGGEIINCYNTGTVTVSNASKMMVGGIVGESQKGAVINCYNIGEINAGGYIGGIVGRNGYDSSSVGTVINSYCTTQTTCSYWYYVRKNVTSSYEGQVEESILSTYASILGDEFTNDKKNENGIWKYNNGYPILKWQNQ